MLSTKIEGISLILTLDRNRPVIRNGSILVEDGKISAIGPEDALRSVHADLTVEGKGRLAAPGFVDCHAHLSYGHSMKGLVESAKSHSEYLRRVFSFQRSMRPEEEYYTALLAIAELLRNGCTSLLEPGLVNDVGSVVRAVRTSGIRAVVGKSFADAENTNGMYLTETAEALRQTGNILEKFDGIGGLVTSWVMPFSPDCCTDEFLLSAAELARRQGTGIATHCGMRTEDANSRSEGDRRGQIARLHRIGILGRKTLLAHPLFVDDREMEMIASTGTGAVFCPSSSARSHGPGAFRAVPEMLRRGITVGVGSDSASSSRHLDMTRSMHLLSLLCTGTGDGASHLLPDRLLEMGTLSGARALGIGHQTGSLSIGKSADIVIFNTKTSQWRALFNPFANLMDSADGRSIERVMVEGRTVVEDGHLTAIDEEMLCDRVQEIGENVAGRLGVSPDGVWPEW